MALHHPKSMQQIAILIITFLVYVHGITIATTNTNNINTNTNSNISLRSSHDGADNHVSNEKTLQNFSKSTSFTPSQPLSGLVEIQNNARQAGGFQPMNLIGFTPDDAIMPQKYPPSYEAPNYYNPGKMMEYAVKRYSSENTFAFPNNDGYENMRPPPSNFNYNMPTEIPNSLQTTPVVSYLDPYTNQNYQYTSPPNHLYGSYTKPPSNHRPQEYTVQSSMLVEQQQRPGGGGNSFYNSNYQRPGFVFDEKVDTNYQSPATYRPVTQQSLDYQREIVKPTSPGSAANKISYDSHDYPPPSYADIQTSNFERPPPRPEFTAPTRPTGPPLPPPTQLPTRPPFLPTLPPKLQQSPYDFDIQRPNFANNIDNYLQGFPQQSQRPQEYYPLQQQQRPPPFENDFDYKPLQGRPPFGQPPFNNYYEYQLGEIPPSLPPSSLPQVQRPMYRPLPPPLPPGPPGLVPTNQPPSGLASLASLFAPNPQQQYAPQFANNPLGSLFGAFTSGLPSSSQSYFNNGGFGGGAGGGYGGTPSNRPLNTQLIKALENIARNDDLQCVPKVLCQMIAGQTQRGQLPSFITSPAITNFLAGFPASSPALIYGRAALLGISGGENSCTQTYVKCPKNEYEILYYLNNHRGGFFKFFSEPEEPQASQHTQSSNYGGTNSFLSILAALTGNPLPAPTTTTPRPTRPTRPPQQLSGSSDITSGIGNFFTKLLSEYVGGPTVEYERRRKRRSKRSPLRFLETKHNDPLDSDLDVYEDKFDEIIDSEDFHDEEDNEDTQHGGLNVDDKFNFDTQERFRKNFKFEDELNEDHQHNVKFQNEDRDLDSYRVFRFQNDAYQPRFQNKVQFLDIEGRFANDQNVAIDNKSILFPKSNKKRQVEDPKALIDEFNRLNAQKKLRFPTSTDDRMYVESENPDKRHSKVGRSLKLPEESSATSTESNKDKFFHKISPDAANQITFPDSYQHLIRQGRIVNRPTYAGFYENYTPDYDGNTNILLYDNENKPYDDGDSKPFSERELSPSYNPPAQKISYPNLVIHPNLLSTYSDNFNNMKYYSNKFSSISGSSANPFTNPNTIANPPYPATTNNYFGTRPNLVQPNNPYQQPQSTFPLKNQNYQNIQNQETYPKYEIPNFSNYPNKKYPNYQFQNYPNYQNPATTSTRRPYRRAEDDRNVYVTNGNGITEYYITPDGRKVYLK